MDSGWYTDRSQGLNPTPKSKYSSQTDQNNSKACAAAIRALTRHNQKLTEENGHLKKIISNWESSLLKGSSLDILKSQNLKLRQKIVELESENHMLAEYNRQEFVLTRDSQNTPMSIQDNPTTFGYDRTNLASTNKLSMGSMPDSRKSANSQRLSVGTLGNLPTLDRDFQEDTLREDLNYKQKLTIESLQCQVQQLTYENDQLLSCRSHSTAQSKGKKVVPPRVQSSTARNSRSKKPSTRSKSRLSLNLNQANNPQTTRSKSARHRGRSPRIEYGSQTARHDPNVINRIHDMERDVQETRARHKHLQQKSNSMNNVLHIHKLELNNLSKDIEQKSQMLASMKY